MRSAIARSLALFVFATSAAWAAKDSAKADDVVKAEKRMENFKTRIDAGKADKSLTAKEAAKAEADYFGIAKMIAEAKADGTVTNAELKAIQEQQEALDKAIFASRHNELTVATVQKRMENFKTRIDAGKADKSLTAKEAARAEADYYDIAKKIAEAKADGAVTEAELKAIHERQEALNKTIYAERHNVTMATAQKRMEDFKTRIDAGKADKSLTAKEAAKAEVDYFDIAKMIAEAKADGTVTEGELQAIHERQEKLHKAIYAVRHN